VKLKLAAMLPVLAAIVAPAVSAQCAPVIEAPSRVDLPGDGSGYDPFEIAPLIEPVEIAIRNDGDSACRLRLALLTDDTTGRLISGVDALSYTVSDFTGSGVDIKWPVSNAGVPPHTLPVAVAAKETQPIKLTIGVPAGQVLPSRLYSGDAELRLIDETGQVVGSAARLRFESQIISRSQITVAGSSQAAGGRNEVVDFGELTTNETKSVFLIVSSNDAFDLALISEKGGVLKEFRGLDQIPYQIDLAGRTATLLTTPTPVGPFGASSLAGVSLPLTFTIGDVEGKRAGDYSDEVTITVIGRD
jgi:hypothetical protein